MIYKYCPPSKHSISNLRSRTLFCRHFADFNDPFEFWSKMATGVPTADEPERVRAALAAWGFPGSEYEEDQDEYFASLESTEPPFQLLYDYTRIACFASEDTSLLMWSHYADGLRGFCIGLDENLLIQIGDDGYLTDVEYLVAPPLVDAFVYAVAGDQYDSHMQCIVDRPRNEAYLGTDHVSDADYSAVADDALATMRMIWRRAFAAKPAEWSYEREKRLLFHHSAGGTEPIQLPWPADALSEVIVGERMPPAFRAELMAVVASFPAPVRILEAYRADDSFTLALRPIVTG